MLVNVYFSDMSFSSLYWPKEQCLSKKNDRGIVQDLKEYGWANCAETRTLRVCYFGLTVLEPRTIVECGMSVWLCWISARWCRFREQNYIGLSVQELPHVNKLLPKLPDSFTLEYDVPEFFFHQLKYNLLNFCFILEFLFSECVYEYNQFGFPLNSPYGF